MRKPYQPLNAYEKAIDYLSRRDHSAYELKTKLKQKGYTAEEIQIAIEQVGERGYLPDASKVADKVANTLHRKLKGILYIQNYLKSKNLPQVNPDWEMELEKAQKLVHKQLKGQTSKEVFDVETKEAIFRYLLNRGFARQTIQKVVNAKDLDF